MPEFKFPTETVELPSKGFFYPAEHPLKEGKVEMKYMTAKEEDILANANYIQQGIVLDKLLESLIISPKFNLEDLLIGDKNALLVAARILGYGSNYTVSYGSKTQTIDLSKLENINNDFNIIIECDSEKNQAYFDQILKMLKDNCNEANLVKIEKETKTVIIYYRVSFGNLDNIKSLMNTLDKDFKDAKFSFYENKILD